MRQLEGSSDNASNEDCNEKESRYLIGSQMKYLMILLSIVLLI